jgi:hypothetical protein
MNNEETKEEKQIRKLKERKLELEVLISSVELNLERHGYHLSPEERMPVPQLQGKGQNQRIVNKPQPGIRIQNKLSYRGKEKCYELYDRLDEDCDQKLNFNDMRVMKSLSSPMGLVTDPTYLRRYALRKNISRSTSHLCLFHLPPSESWAMAMEDQGISTHDSYINIDEFIKYRQMIELQTPLSSDLMSARIGYLPRLQRRWIRVKDRIKNCLSVRSAEEKIEKDEGKLFSSLWSL